jgi:hypothetical protein
MEIENLGTGTATPAPAPAATPAPAAAPAPSTPAPAAPASAAGQEPAASTTDENSVVIPPAYVPNFKYKVFGKEKEIDEQFRSLIKDAESEKRVREIFEKADGLEHVKEDRQTVRQQLEAVKAERVELDKSLETLSHFVRTDNMKAFFETLKIPEDKILRYAYQRLQYREMTPEQRAQVDGQTQAEQRAYFLQQQNESLLQNFAQTAETQRRSELEMHLAQPNIAQTVQAFDARVGKPGAFVEEVINRGKYHWFANQKDIPVSQAIAEVMSLIGGAPPAAPAGLPNGVIPNGQQAGQSHVPGQNQNKPVIPNIQGNGNSPAKKVPRSLDDLRKLAAQKTSSR